MKRKALVSFGAVRNVLCLLLFLALAVATYRLWLPRGIILTADIDAQSPFSAQVYYCETPDQFFYATRRVCAGIPAGHSQAKFLLPVNKICRLRFDFGSKPGTVVLSDVVVSGNDIQLLMADDWIFPRDVDAHSVTKAGGLSVSSKKDDPYAVYQKPILVESGLFWGEIWSRFPLIALWLAAMYMASYCVVAFGCNVASRLSQSIKAENFASLDGKRVFSLDGVRVVAFLFVVFAHVLAQGDAVTIPKYLDIHHFYWGALGVSMFFCLSGAALSVGSLDHDVGYWAFYKNWLCS